MSPVLRAGCNSPPAVSGLVREPASASGLEGQQTRCEAGADGIVRMKEDMFATRSYGACELVRPRDDLAAVRLLFDGLGRQPLKGTWNDNREN